MALANIYYHFKKHRPTPKALVALLQFVLFFALFDGLTTYLTPLLITSHHISIGLMGLLIASSSIFGGVFDLFLSQLIRQSHYFKILSYMLLLCFGYLLILFSANSIWLYLIAMAIWGLYYDLFNFSLDDFVSSQASLELHTSYHGLINSFKAIGYVASPLLAGLILTNYNFNISLLITSSALILCGFSWLNLKATYPAELSHHPYKTKFKPLTEIKRWLRLYPRLKPFLIITFGNHFLNAIVWTIGPLFALVTHQTGLLAHMFVLMYMLPTILVGFWLDDISKRLGSFKSSLGTYTLAGLILTLSLIIYLTGLNLLWLYPILFATSLLSSISISTSRSQITQHINHHLNQAKDDEGVEDFFVNLGYIAGPSAAGLLITFLNFSLALTLVGLFIFVLGLFLYSQHRRKNYFSLP